jgi:hypothetical protein
VCYEGTTIEGDSPVGKIGESLYCMILESGCLGVQPSVGGIFHLMLNMGMNPIANK